MAPSFTYGGQDFRKIFFFQPKEPIHRGRKWGRGFRPPSFFSSPIAWGYVRGGPRFLFFPFPSTPHFCETFSLGNSCVFHLVEPWTPAASCRSLSQGNRRSAHLGQKSDPCFFFIQKKRSNKRAVVKFRRKIDDNFGKKSKRTSRYNLPLHSDSRWPNRNIRRIALPRALFDL